MGGVFNPEGWQRVAGGRSGAETPGRQSQASAHPEGMPEFCDPSGVVWRFLNRPTGGVAALDPRLLFRKPPACAGHRTDIVTFFDYYEVDEGRKP
jgi:hypothetical protein